MSCEELPKPIWLTDTSSLFSSTTTESVVSSKGSSNDVGSARMQFLTARYSRYPQNEGIFYKKTHELNTPKDIDTGARVRGRGVLVLREQVVRPVSSSNLAWGSRAMYKRVGSGWIRWSTLKAHCFLERPPWRSKSRRTRSRRSLYTSRRRRGPMLIFAGGCREKREGGF
jgi:hypothetical protein